MLGLKLFHVSERGPRRSWRLEEHQVKEGNSYHARCSLLSIGPLNIWDRNLVNTVPENALSHQNAISLPQSVHVILKRHKVGMIIRRKMYYCFHMFRCLRKFLPADRLLNMSYVHKDYELIIRGYTTEVSLDRVQGLQNITMTSYWAR